MLGQMKEKLHSPLLENKLIPGWSVGCRRLTPGFNYLESLTEPNVEVVCGEITKITESVCFVDDGQPYSFDVLICATGFDTSFKPRCPIVGPSGDNLQDTWSENPESYFGVAVADFPNYFLVLGPTSRSATAQYFQPSRRRQHKDQFMEKTVWSDACRSWYKLRDDGPVVALWPDSTLHYMEAIKEVRFDDLDVKYGGNRFAWLGNGYSQTELDETADWAYYIRDEDDDPPLTTAGKRSLLTRSGTVKERNIVVYSGNRDRSSCLGNSKGL
ncbi:putative sterigmatocystin biosynthesis monooxygenase stcW [Colletotrichum orbiculare MAFF 240422]|uniref:Sterigmatocystin biosynthesis monooxygenase stcW n=1 Tax=Colletotrichum orbiculare (strain 104-T / ATCC 96160 / CBS 514.97 / LARS 414 / MAFF 240422) TaxID=1213857 RepID=A0A484FHR2_COLOR|nr:putative sterigmatocystin biosynthesis monooxygenase stcW [Colletotrichum orbiculare MAFF 240422]